MPEVDDATVAAFLGALDRMIQILTRGPKDHAEWADQARLAVQDLSHLTLDLGMSGVPVAWFTKWRAFRDFVLYLLTPIYNAEPAKVPLPAAPEVLSDLRQFYADFSGEPQAAPGTGRDFLDGKPLTDGEQEVLDLIRAQQPIPGKKIETTLGLAEKTLPRIVKKLKRLGVKSQYGAGYYIGEKGE
jgi:hypothetical protein